MQGFNTLWMPGTDHAGIATQNVVEKQLAKEKLHRWELGRDKFIERVWEWKKEYGGQITNQLRRLGSSLDWERERFTMDGGLSDAVLETFINLYDKGLIYKGKYIINWCPRCGTALADDEVEHEEHEGHLWYLQYTFKDDQHEYITVATTRPETMLGDTAVAVNPDDQRYKHLIGRKLILPILGREIPIIADPWVDSEFGTGAVKVTPAHDPNDFEMGKRHDLDTITVIDEDGNMTAEAGEFEGMDRFECREALIEEMKEHEDLESVEPHVHSVGHCYRCSVVVEPYLSDQWFVKMQPLARKAIDATDDGRVNFHPQRWTGFYKSWLENVRDWCISRQIWWGHRLPVYYCQECDHTVVARKMPENCEKCNSGEFQQDEDVLDTWFSSALWPFSTLGWPEETEELKRYYPTNTLITDRGIIYFWVARMVMMGLELRGEAPFSDVMIHGTILDERGRKMSKSLGNGIDPIEMIEKYGADAVRFSLIMLTTEGQDVKLSESKFEMGRNFANKVWNASRFTLMNLDINNSDSCATEEEDSGQKRRFEDRWILSRLHSATGEITDYLDDFRLNEAAQVLYDFFWHDFCDWYLEACKTRMQDEDDLKDIAAARETLASVLDASLRLMHPFVPFLSEVLWQQLKEIAPDGAPGAAEKINADALIVADWPKYNEKLKDINLEEDMHFLQQIISTARRLRKEKGTAENAQLNIVISAPDQEIKALIEDHKPFLAKMAFLDDIECDIQAKKPSHSATSVVDTTEIFFRLEGLIDLEKEKERLEEQRLDVTDHIGKVEKQLDNPDFLANAPDEVVRRQKKRSRELRSKLEKIIQNLADIE